MNAAVTESLAHTTVKQWKIVADKDNLTFIDDTLGIVDCLVNFILMPEHERAHKAAVDDLGAVSFDRREAPHHKQALGTRMPSVSHLTDRIVSPVIWHGEQPKTTRISVMLGKINRDGADKNTRKTFLANAALDKFQLTLPHLITITKHS